MTYAQAWETYRHGDDGSPDYEQAAEHIRIADYDLAAGIIQDVTDYDE